MSNNETRGDGARDDRAVIEEILIRRDVEAFVAGDWSAAALDFDTERFAGYSGRDGGMWQLAYPTLDAYAQDWSEQSKTLRQKVTGDLAAQLLRVQRLSEIKVHGDHALVVKDFSGHLDGAGGPIETDWRTYYFLRRVDDSDWKITGFVGYLPRPASDTVPLEYPETSQHTSAGPYSPVVVARPRILAVTSGQGPLDDAGQVVSPDIAAQTRATIANCERQLAAAGLSLSHVFKVTIYLTDLATWHTVNAVYAELIPQPRPARTTIGADLLAGMGIEIEMWAAG